ncbi:MAG: TlyA family rRNA (cytidine-2'-O)-methyltransferase, partial [Anaerolineales bacterium]|nr:TlyA family rRNA (cytidine-2'-O)-methyltransferase [Anaerolineales bacterium]
MKKIRLDLLLVERGLVENRSQAQSLIMAGRVRLKGELANKPGIMVTPEAEIALASNPRFVSRGGEKLDTALISFRVDVNDLVCADVGASTGGFCDCLLQHGAVKVYAIDV